MKPRNPQIPDPSKTPIPNYGRGAFSGLISMLVVGVAWAILIEVTGRFNMGIMLAIGWMIGWAVKRGMGTVDRVGVWIVLYGTLAGILIGTCLYIGALIDDGGSTVTIEGIAREFWVALTDLKFLALFVGFTLAACWLGVAVCKEGMPNPLDFKSNKKIEDEKASPEK